MSIIDAVVARIPEKKECQLRKGLPRWELPDEWCWNCFLGTVTFVY
jgi:hypothetical protein